MGLNHLGMHFGEKAGPFIGEGGGKIGGLNYLRATVPALKDAILPVQVIGPDEKLGDIKVPAGDHGQYIVRGSHPMDFQGLVDVLATKVDIRYVGKWVEHVQRQAKSPAVMAYGQYENPSYNGRVLVGIQPYLDCQKGSIVEHPNIPGTYVVSYVDARYETGVDEAITTVYDSKQNRFKWISGVSHEVTGGAEERTKRAVELYQHVDTSGLAKPGLSLQVEFLNPKDQLYVAQVRAFKEKQQANFELNAIDRLVFGVTPQEGIVVPVYLSTDGFVTGDQPSYKEPWAYLKPMEPGRVASIRDILCPKSEAEKEAERLKFKPENMAAYLIGQSFSSQINTSLEHRHFRMAQKANVTVFEGGYSQLGLRGDFTNLFYGDPGDVEAHERLFDNLISLASIGGSTRSDLMTQLFQGRLMYNAKIVSDGRTATVEAVSSSKKRKR